MKENEYGNIFLRLQYLEGANWVTMMNYNENAKKSRFFFLSLSFLIYHRGARKFSRKIVK